jgi:hypothetical protein
MHPLSGKRGLSAFTLQTGYLRVSVMHNFAGGYRDIKAHPQSWNSPLNEFDHNENLWLYGTPWAPGASACDEA